MAIEREPTLNDLLNEPIIRQVMAVDGYSADDIRLLMRQARARGHGSGRPRLPTTIRDAETPRWPIPWMPNHASPPPA
jgi:hypothetical protein